MREIIITIIMLLIPSFVFAATTGLSKSRFDVQGNVGEVANEELWVTNTDTIEQRYGIKIDNPSFARNISILPDSFFLFPGESQKVVIRFRQPLEGARTFLSLISFDNNQSSQMRVGSGIKIPVGFAAAQAAGASEVARGGESDKINKWHAVVWALDWALLIFFLWLLRRGKPRLSRSGDYKINFL